MRPWYRLLATAVLVTAATTAACGPEDEAPKTPIQSPSSSATESRPATPTTPSSRPSPAPPPEPRRVRLRGIDASHHQGAIDWRAVAGDGIGFAYLKASEGTTYVDPTFAAHRAEARRQGIRVGGYHYFQLCSPGVEQAVHFVEVLGEIAGDTHLPPAVDLEIAGSCDTPPPRAALLAEVRAFLDRVEAGTGRAPVVYLYPDFEERYGFAAELADHRQWVRSLDRPPDRRWWIWQRTDSGTVAGIAGPVDVNVMWGRP